MPFFSSVSGSKGGFLLKLSNVAPPVAVMSATTNFNQNRATFNATVTSIGGPASVKFQYSTNGTTWTDGETISNITGIAQSVYSNQTGLSVGTLYYVRAVVTNANSSVTSLLNNIFTTWSLKSTTFTGSGSQTIQTVTPTGATAIVPSIYDVLVVGGGGGAVKQNYTAGGGGGYQTRTSQSFLNTNSLSLTVTIGAGGAYNNAMNGTAGNSGGNSSITGSSFASITAVGGKSSTDAAATNSGESGGGNFAGTSAGYWDLKGNGSVSSVGGGGGAGGAGGNGTINPNDKFGVPTGGSGGPGYTSPIYSITIGSGGGGGVSTNSTQGGYRGTTPASSYGGGGYGSVYLNGSLASEGIGGQSGYVSFKYYGP